MEMEDMVIRFVIAAAIIYIFATVYLYGAQQRPPDMPQSVVLEKTPTPESIAITSSIFHAPDDKCQWPPITIPIKVKFSTDLKSSLDIVPIVTFNGKDFRATVEGMGSTFQLSPTNPTFGGNLVISNVVTKEPPIGKADINQNIDFKKGKKFLLFTKAPGDERNLIVNYTLKLDGMQRKNKICIDTFEIECSNRLYSFDLSDINKACTSGLLDNCQKIITMCNNTLTITGEKISADDGSCLDVATVIVKTEQKDNPFDKTFEVGEKFGVTFLNNSQCIRNFDSLSQMRVPCGSDFLGGTYLFIGPIVDAQYIHC